VFLGLGPFILILAAYLAVSHVRLEANPQDRLTPAIGKMADAVRLMAFTPDKRTGKYLLLTDTYASLRRIAIGLGAAAIVGLFLGLNMGLFPGMNATLLPVIKFLFIVPPLSILPILFIVLGVDELGKVSLIFLGSVFVITRDIHQETRRIPEEQIVKALTLGASQFQVVYEVILPQIVPCLLVAIRLCLGGAWLFLIASEAIASTEGLGYRIFLVRRYMAMDIIIPYVLWITFLGFIMDGCLRLLLNRRFRWYTSE
jgi:NitT/TauT family transport system permease protein